MSASPTLSAAFRIPATLAEFEITATERDDARRSLELACACGAALALEKAFLDCPRAAELYLEADCDGSFLLKISLRDDSGALFSTDALGDCAYLVYEHELLAGRAPQAQTQRALFEALDHQNLSGDEALNALNEIDGRFYPPLRAFEARAPSFFFTFMGLESISIARGDAVEIARQMRAPDVAIALEAAQLSRVSFSGAASLQSARSL